MARGSNSDAQQPRTARSNASWPSMLRNVLCCPANDASSVSSAVAEDRTATRPPPSASYDSHSAAVHAGCPVASTINALARAAAVSTAARSSRSTSSASRRSATIPQSSMNARYACVVTTKPGGTGMPAAISSPRFAPLPPAMSTSPRRRSPKGRMCGCAPNARPSKLPVSPRVYRCAAANDRASARAARRHRQQHRSDGDRASQRPRRRARL